MIRKCTCGPREFVPGDEGRCYRCQGLAPPRCPTCERLLTDNEIAGGTCQTCGGLIGGTA